MLGVDEFPLRHIIELRKKRIPLHLGMHSSEVHAVGTVQGLLEDLRSSTDEDFFVQTGHFNRPLERWRGLYSVGPIIRIVRDDHDRATGKRTLQRLERLAPHQE